MRSKVKEKREGYEVKLGLRWTLLGCYEKYAGQS